MNARILVAATTALCVSAGIQAQSSMPTPTPRLFQVALDDLRVAYLTCDRMASQLNLDADSGTRCALVSQALLQRGFGGSVEELLKWRSSARSTNFAAKQALAFKTLALAARDRDQAPRVQNPPTLAFKQ